MAQDPNYSAYKDALFEAKTMREFHAFTNPALGPDLLAEPNFTTAVSIYPDKACNFFYNLFEEGNEGKRLVTELLKRANVFAIAATGSDQSRLKLLHIVQSLQHVQPDQAVLILEKANAFGNMIRKIPVMAACVLVRAFTEADRHRILSAPGNGSVLKERLELERDNQRSTALISEFNL